MRRLLRRLAQAAFFLLLAGATVSGQTSASPTPTDAYDAKPLHGWTIRVAPSYREDADALDEVMTEVERQLGNIAGVVPDAALAYLKTTMIWLEYRRDAPERARYHRSAGWLKKNGFNPDKAKGIEIDYGLLKSARKAPWSLMHELTHAYFDGPLNRDAPMLETAYNSALAARLYDSVMRNTGRTQQAYAMNNVSEYFAELSEAYFGENDFEPFTREQLRDFDPAGYAAVQALWTLH